MASEPKTVKLTLRHRGKVGMRVIHDANHQAHTLTPGGTVGPVEFTENRAKDYQQQSVQGVGDIEVVGSEPEQGEAEQAAPSRAEIEQREAELARTASGGPVGGAATGRETVKVEPKTRNQLDGMTKDELMTHASTMKLELSPSDTKAELVDAIMAEQRKQK